MSPHPNLPLVREDFFDGDRYVIAMDWVEGIDLARVLQTRGHPGLAPSLVMNWLADAAAALAHLHTQHPPVVHGDVKPANLILGPEGRVTLVDFGVSSTPGLSPRRSGTRGYIAPEVEQWRRGQPGRRRLRARRDRVRAPQRRATERRAARSGKASIRSWPPSSKRRSGSGSRPIPRAGPATPGELVERLRAGWTSTLPSGVLTFCVTDIEGAAELWDRTPSEMARALAGYNEVVAATVEQHGGRFVTSMADATVSVFASPGRRRRRRVAVSRRDSRPSRASDGIRIDARIGLNTGEATGRDGDYSGPGAARRARVRAISRPAARCSCRARPPTSCARTFPRARRSSTSAIRSSRSRPTPTRRRPPARCARIPDSSRSARRTRRGSSAARRSSAT